MEFRSRLVREAGVGGELIDRLGEGGGRGCVLSPCNHFYCLFPKTGGGSTRPPSTDEDEEEF